MSVYCRTNVATKRIYYQQLYLYDVLSPLIFTFFISFNIFKWGIPTVFTAYFHPCHDETLFKSWCSDRLVWIVLVPLLLVENWEILKQKWEKRHEISLSQLHCHACHLLFVYGAFACAARPAETAVICALQSNKIWTVSHVVCSWSPTEASRTITSPGWDSRWKWLHRWSNEAQWRTCHGANHSYNGGLWIWYE